MDVDNLLLRQAYFWKFEIASPPGNWESDVLFGGDPKDKKTRDTLNWLQEVIDGANAQAIERSALIVEKQMHDLFENDVWLHAMSEMFPMKPQAPVEFDQQELADRFESDVNLFRDIREWIYKIGIPYLKSLPDSAGYRYWGNIQKLNTVSVAIDCWSYEKDGDERVRLIKKAGFVVEWLSLLCEAGIERDKISKKAFEKWRIQNGGNAGTAA